MFKNQKEKEKKRKKREEGSGPLTIPFCFLTWQFYCIILKTFKTLILTENNIALSAR